MSTLFCGAFHVNPLPTSHPPKDKKNKQLSLKSCSEVYLIIHDLIIIIKASLNKLGLHAHGLEIAISITFIADEELQLSCSIISSVWVISSVRSRNTGWAIIQRIEVETV